MLDVWSADGERINKYPLFKTPGWCSFVAAVLGANLGPSELFIKYRIMAQALSEATKPEYVPIQASDLVQCLWIWRVRLHEKADVAGGCWCVQVCASPLPRLGVAAL